MSDFSRDLLYPLGFLSAFAFSARMLIQWLLSESRGRSVVVPIFWKLSLFANLLLVLHSFIQVQFHVCMIQSCQAVISWRNLNLMRPPAYQASLSRVIQFLILASGTVVIAFILQDHFLMNEHSEWFRIPTAPWQLGKDISVSWEWHALGFFGLVLFSSRFWIQWWCAERNQKSYLGAGFWWCSLVGEGLCLTYFLKINDPVNFLGPLFGMIPYIRNLMLIQKQKNIRHKA